jgi:EpsD family peptidyl-prolyl cis-trans isomerase
MTLLSRPPRLRALLLLMWAVAGASLLGGCGEKKKDKVATQAAARVDKEEITVHQINLVLQEQRNLRPEQADAASRQILERLIDQEVAVQKAEELKLDRDPRVVQMVEAAKRQVLARAYAEKTGEGVPKPTPEEVKKYFDEKPALFRERRIYSIQEFAIEAKPDQVALLREKLAAAKSINEFIEYLKANDYRFAANQAVRAAEQLPAAALETLSRMKDGQASVIHGSAGLQVVVLAGSRSQPVAEEQARPAIEQYLMNERKRKRIEDDIKSLRAAAKIEYMGKFAEGRPAAGAASAPAAGAAPAAAPASGLSPADINKGMGLK